MSNKIFVLDTNVLLSSGGLAVLQMGEDNTVYIPLTVFEEMDNQKMRGDSNVAFEARAAIRALNGLIGDGDAIDGITLENGSVLKVIGRVEHTGLMIEETCNDDKIINTAIHLQHKNPDGVVVLVSNDINMRLKAKAAGVRHAEEYRNDIIVNDESELPTGTVTVDADWLPNIPSDKIKYKSCGLVEIDSDYVPEEVMYLNTWIIEENEEFVAVLRHIDNEAGICSFDFMNMDMFTGRRAAGIQPRNVKQSIALDSILDSDIDIVILDGAAGSGKTLLAMAGATEMVKGKKSGNRYERIIFTRANVTDMAEIGFLPGSETEKMSPWLACCADNMEVIARMSKNMAYHPLKSISGKTQVEEGQKDTSFIDLKAAMFFRGRSIGHRVMVIDECQNLTAKQLKMLLSRAGEYCKVILIGNNNQIDNKELTARTSGLTYAMNKFAGCEFAQVLKLEGVVRSRLAEFVENNF